MPSLGFGFEKLGLLPLRAPRLILCFIILMSVVCGAGLQKLSSDSAISDLFKSNTVEYRNYQSLKETFPTSENDILVVLKGQDILSADNLETLRNVSLDVQFAEGVQGVISLFDMRGKPNKKGYAPLIIPEELPSGEKYDKLIENVQSHPLITGKLLSEKDAEGTQISLIQLTLQNGIVDNANLKTVVAEIKKIIDETIEGSSLSYELAGTPVMQMEIRNAIKKDRLVFNTAGFLLGFIICFLFFRQIKLAFIASLCPVIAVSWALGIFGHLELQLNTFLNVIPPLVMVIAYSDAMHMVYSIRRRIARGEDKKTAISHAVLNVGPACVLTSLTTSFALISLAITDSATIKLFGLSAAFATLLAFVVIILVVPTLCYLWINDENKFREAEKEKGKQLNRMASFCTSLAHWITPRYLTISLFSGLLMGLFIAMHLQLLPHYKLSDQLPDNKNIIETSKLIDEKLSGAFPVHVMIKMPKEAKLESKEVLELIEKSHNIVEQEPIVGNVWSLEILRRWVFQNIEKDKEKNFLEYLGKMPEHLTARMLKKDENILLVTGRIPNLDSDEITPIIKNIEKKFSQLQTDYPDYKFTVTGLITLTALQSSDMIQQLNTGLMVAIVIVIVLIGVAFRSYKAIILAIAPNIFPIVAAGALLYVNGNGLEYASVIGLTVAFGLAVDDSIHFLNRLYIERARSNNWETAVFQTVERIGPVLLLTTVVLVLGLAVTILSDLPPLRLFGQLSMTTLVTALIADLIILPAIILSAIRLRIITHGNSKHSNSKEA